MADKKTQTLDAYEAGSAWAASLKAGDKFPGTRVEADRRYTTKHEQSAFSLGAFRLIQRGGLLLEDDECKVSRGIHE